MDDVERLLLRWLDDLHEPTPEGETARASIRALWASEPARLLTALHEARYVLRARAADALGMLGDAAAVADLLSALGDEVDVVRGHAANALGQIGDLRAVDPLIDMLGGDDVWLQWAAAEALGHLADPAAVVPLLEAWLDAEHEALLKVITESFQRMGAIGRPALEAASQSDRDDLRRAAGYMLSQLP